jgi:Pvc16 N-terminal domain
MSTALAIASVTAVLKDLLNNGVIDHNLSAVVGADVVVSALPPDRVDAVDINPVDRKSRLNLFLYQVTPNAGWRNVGLPSRDASGERVSNPPLAIDLHYLLTAYGAEEVHAEILLGYGMQLFHETPVLTRAKIHIALAPPTPVVAGGDLPPALRDLFKAELAEQVEQIKITPQALSTEEISRMWSAFQAKYRPTAAYQASVVLIESRRATKAALPVRHRNVYVVPFRQPVIDRILSQRQTGDPVLPEQAQPILAGYNLAISGRQLRGGVTSVSVSGISAIPADRDVTDTQIIVKLPAGLQAGVQGVQVVQQQLMGSPEVPHGGVESNLGAFVLHPELTAPTTLSNVQTAPDGTRSADVQVTIQPPVGPTQRTVLLLNAFQAGPLSPPAADGGAARAYSFLAPPRFSLDSPPAVPPPPQSNITIPIQGVQPGPYLLRVQVDGADSPLGVDVTGQFDSPQVTI